MIILNPYLAETNGNKKKSRWYGKAFVLNKPVTPNKESSYWLHTLEEMDKWL